MVKGEGGIKIYQAKIGGAICACSCLCCGDGPQPLAHCGIALSLPQMLIVALGCVIMTMTIWGQYNLQVNERKIKK